MTLFGKKKEGSKSCCSCTPEDMARAETSKTAAGIQVPQMQGAGRRRSYRADRIGAFGAH